MLFPIKISEKIYIIISKIKINNNIFHENFLSLANLSKSSFMLFKNFILYIKGNIIILNNKEVTGAKYKDNIIEKSKSSFISIKLPNKTVNTCPIIIAGKSNIIPLNLKLLRKIFNNMKNVYSNFFLTILLLYQFTKQTYITHVGNMLIKSI